MSTLKEKVARALHESCSQQDINGYLDAKIDCAVLARAALAVVREEMREPTPEMLSIGGEGAEGLKRKLWYHMLYASPLGEDGK